MKIDIHNIKQRIIDGYKITFEEALELSKTENKQLLYNAANEIRQHFCGNYLDTCSIINAKSGKCSENCKWCSQSKFHTTGIDEYEMIDQKEAVRQAKFNSEKGVNKYSLVTSGKAISNKDLTEIIGIYEDIKKTCDIYLCASLGLLKKDQLQKLKDTGIGHYHCNIETAPSFFHELCSTHTIDDKIQTINWAKEVGLEICSGGIIGMGESLEQRLEMAFLLSDLNVLSIPINILNPIKGTALENQESLTEEEILTTIALFRFINPKANLRFAGGRMQIKSFENKALNAGINAALVGDLLTTIGSTIEEDRKLFEEAGFDMNLVKND